MFNHTNSGNIDEIQTHIDLVLSHSRTLATLGLYKMFQDKMIRFGDGEKLVQSYKHLLVWCRQAGFNNYSTGLLEQQYQVATLSAKLRCSVVWNRFVNNKGGSDSNLPVDLDVEHENKYFKERLTTYRGDYSQKSLDKISKANNITRMVIRNVAKSTNYYRTNAHSNPPAHNDILKLVDHLHQENLWKEQPGRYFLQVHLPGNALTGNLASTQYWSERNVSYWNSKHYYRYAQGKK